MPYTAYGMLTPFSEYNEKTIRKSLKTRNYSIENISKSPVILPDVSVAPSGESFRNIFFFLRMVQSFYRGHLQNTTNNVTGAQEDHDRSRYAAYSVNVVFGFFFYTTHLLLYYDEQHKQ